MSEAKTRTNQVENKTSKGQLINAAESENLNRIKQAMKTGEFSIGNLAKELNWPFQKVRHQVHAIARKENKKLTSITRGIWSVK